MSVLASFDVAGRRRSPATTAEFHLGRTPGNKGMNYPADPPRVEETRRFFIVTPTRLRRHGLLSRWSRSSGPSAGRRR
jgi:hypothetical protein